MPNSEGKWVSIGDFQKFHNDINEEFEKHKAAGKGNYIFVPDPEEGEGRSNNPNYIKKLCADIITEARKVCAHGVNYRIGLRREL